MIDDTVLSLSPCPCGGKPIALYGPRSVVLCEDCGETTTVDTAPFFANPGSQREYETHKTMGVWNEQMGDKP